MEKRVLTMNGLHIGSTHPVRIMGVINLSPESFYSGSIVTNSAELLSRVKKIVEEGADILDIGAVSTAPKNYYGTENTSRAEEMSRVTSSLSIVAENTDIPISIDTSSAAIAETALDLGASIVNDVTGLQGDQKMAKLIAKKDVPIIIMAHCQDACKSCSDSYDAIKKSLKIADAAGIPLDNIIIDPGIGFGKPPEVDLTILKELDRFKELGRPLLVGVSRKAFIGAILNEANPENRLIGSLAATVIAVVNGADVIRTHDVKETKLAVKMAEALR